MRPKKCRRINCDITAKYFKPRGIPISDLEEVELLVDEFEAIRLADHEGLYHEEAAKKMNISRATFGRILETVDQGHGKVWWRRGTRLLFSQKLLLPARPMSNRAVCRRSDR